MYKRQVLGVFGCEGLDAFTSAASFLPELKDVVARPGYRRTVQQWRPHANGTQVGVGSDIELAEGSYFIHDSTQTTPILMRARAHSVYSLGQWRYASATPGTERTVSRRVEIDPSTPWNASFDDERFDLDVSDRVGKEVIKKKLSEQFGKAIVGTATIELANSDDALTINNKQSPHYGRLGEGKIRVRTIDNGVETYQFQGEIESWTYKTQKPPKYISVVASDTLKDIREQFRVADIPGTEQALTVPEFLSIVSDRLGYSPERQRFDNTHLRVPPIETFERKVDAVITSIVKSEGGAFWAGPRNELVFRNRRYRNAIVGDPVITFSLTDSSFKDTQFFHDQKSRTNRVEFRLRDEDQTIVVYPQGTTPSQVKYGVRTERFDNELISTEHQAIQRAILTLHLFENPVLRSPPLRIPLAQDLEVLYARAASVDLLDLVSLDISPVTDGPVRFLIQEYTFMHERGNNPELMIKLMQPPLVNPWSISDALNSGKNLGY